jgi:hypothetical protein
MCCFFTIAFFIYSESALAIEKNIQCWIAGEFVSKGNATQEKILQIQEIEEVINKVGSISKVILPLAIGETQAVNAWVSTVGNPLVITTSMLDNSVATDSLSA